MSRYALLAYALIVVDASLFPFVGWRDLGLRPYDFLFADWPPHALPFDLAVNAVGYLPLGFVAGLSLHPQLRGAAMVIVAVLGCALLSVNLEALQTYLPARVASKSDLLANVSGGFIGALLAARFAHALLDTSRVRVWRTRWFAGDASRGLVLVVLWFGALVYPDAFVFGTGGLLKVFDPDEAAVIAAATGIANSSDALATAARFQTAEAVVSALGLFGAGLLFLHLLRSGIRWSTRFALVGAFIAITVTIGAFAHAFLHGFAGGWPALTPGSRSGVTAGIVALVLATPLPRNLRWPLGMAALIGSIVLVNIYPDNPYGNPVGLAWTRGKLMNFYGLASGLNLVWPYLAIVYLLRHRRSGRKRGQRSHKPGAPARPSL